MSHGPLYFRAHVAAVERISSLQSWRRSRQQANRTSNPMNETEQSEFNRQVEARLAKARGGLSRRQCEDIVRRQLAHDAAPKRDTSAGRRKTP
jgi:hypothetical protein